MQSLHVMPSYTTSTMDKDFFGYGADGDGNASCSTTFPRSFSLDLEGMLDEAEGALQQQVCSGFFHGPGAVVTQPENLQQMSTTFQESCFSIIPPYHPAGSTSLTDPFHFLPGAETTLRETLQDDTVIGNSVEQSRLPDNGLHLGLPQVPINHDSHILRSPVRRKQFSAGGSSALGEIMLPTSMGSCAPRQVWSMDQTGTFDSRASFQYAPAQPSLGYLDYAAPGTGQACIPNIPRDQFSTDGTSNCSPSSDIISCFQPSKSQKTEDMYSSVQDHRIVKPKRATDPAEHIIRERLRRDDMTSKFHMLESLLPPGPKRDRATIVEDSIQYVKNLHHRVKDLQWKRSEMKTPKSTSMGPRLDLKQQKIPPRDPCSKNKATVQIDNGVEKKAETGCIEKVEVHLSLPGEIVIEMTCRPHAHIQSQVLGALERLRIDVSQCSISRLHGRILCSIAAQPRVIFDPPITSDDIIRALQRAVVQADL